METQETIQAQQVEQQPEQTKPEETKGRSIIPASERGVIIGTSFEQQYRLARAYHTSGLMPQALNSPEKVLVAMQLCHELNLPPMSSIGKICVINGTPSIFGDLPLSLVMRSGLLESITEVLLNKSGVELKPGEEVAGAVCRVKRKGLDPIERSFTRQDADKAGLWGKKVWAVYPKRMFQFRARSWALKDMFPDVLMGTNILEYDHDAIIGNDGTLVAEGVIDGEVVSAADKLNEKYLEKSA